MPKSPLTPQQAARVYDRIGRMQDWQRFYEGPAVRALLDHADFEHAQSVFELGCGTGAMAENLLNEILPDDATYLGVDVSPKMIQLASQRLEPFGDRASLLEVGGRPPLPAQDARFDRFVALYVFELLEESLARDLMSEAKRLLGPDGCLCAVNLTHGTTAPSRAVCSLWNRAWELSPTIVGGCRPVDLGTLLESWKIIHDSTVVAWGIPSQVVVASPL